MAISTKVLSLLRLLDEKDLDMGSLLDYLHEESQAGNLPKTLEPLEAKDRHLLREILSELVKRKREPAMELTDERIKKLLEILPDEVLDEHFTILQLQGIAGIVKRWKKLRTVPVALIPGEKVTAYMRQATTCYIYGLPSAAAALCRTVLEFALNEKRGDLGGTSKPLDLEALINSFARNTKILSTNELARKAHEIRQVGNDAIHKSACTERQALETIEKMGEILSHIYGRSGSGTR